MKYWRLNVLFHNVVLCLAVAGMFIVSDAEAAQLHEYCVRYSSHMYWDSRQGTSFGVLGHHQMRATKVLERHGYWFEVEDDNGKQFWAHCSKLYNKYQNENLEYTQSTPVYERPELDSEVRMNLSVSVKLTIEEHRGDWVRVVDEDGDGGWVEEFRMAAHVQKQTMQESTEPQQNETPSMASQSQTLGQVCSAWSPSLRRSASNQAGIIPETNPQTGLTVIGQFGMWTMVKLDSGRSGWVECVDSSTVSQSKVATATVLPKPAPKPIVQSTQSAQSTVPASTLIPGFKPRLFVLSIGVSKYKDKRLNLRYAAADAKGLAKALKGQPNSIYREVRAKVLTDAQVTRESVLIALTSFLGRAVSTDVVLIFVAGHGSKMKGTNLFYFLPYPANGQTLMTKGLSWSDFEAGVRVLNQRVKNVVLVVDTCHAGSLDVAMRGLEVGQDLSGPFARGGFYTLAAAQSGEAALEAKKWAHGAFTYAILEGLKGRADMNRNRSIDVVELFHYVESRVADLTDGKQHPHFRMGGGSLPLSAIK